MLIVTHTYTSSAIMSWTSLGTCTQSFRRDDRHWKTTKCTTGRVRQQWAMFKRILCVKKEVLCKKNICTTCICIATRNLHDKKQKSHHKAQRLFCPWCKINCIGINKFPHNAHNRDCKQISSIPLWLAWDFYGEYHSHLYFLSTGHVRCKSSAGTTPYL